MLIKPLNAFLKSDIDPATMSYLGMVEDNNDPEKLGRLKVRISPYMDFSSEDLPWALPSLGTHGNTPEAGGINVPEIGSQVRVYFPSHDLTAPHYMGAELNELNRTTFFDDDYPNAYGYKDSKGNFIKVNKARKTVQIQHSSSTNLKVDPNGSIMISLNNGSYFTLDNHGAFELNVGLVSLQGMPDGSLTIKAESGIEFITPSFRVTSDDNTFTGNTTTGSGITDKFNAGDKIISVTNGIITSIE